MYLEVKGQPCRVHSLLPPFCEFQRSNSGHQAYTVTSLPAEPSHWPAPGLGVHLFLFLLHCVL
ncbi:rCG57589, isoform CRA_c [Rattus norvegicus]|uniref:RCG57589, isoform CRA_c n=1 Tax=Rattus norvegicus TaxID=10116 RepID=A6JH91_RAT|nr:rCG57589, isoform CRA_c [Rattus norvegicus]